MAVYFRDPRLEMTLAGRFTVRVLSYVGYLLVIAATFTSIASDLKPLHSLGLFLIFFLIDRLIHRGEADEPLTELPRAGSVNAASYLKPKSFSILERVFDRSRLTRRNFYFEAAHELLDSREIRDGLKKLDVKPDEFKQKLESLLSQSVREKNGAGADILRGEFESLVLQAFPLACAAGHRFIEPGDLFAALPRLSDGLLQRLFGTFSIEADDLERALIFASASRLLRRRRPASLGGFVLESHRRLRRRAMNRAWTARPTPTLDRYSTDFTALAQGEEIGFLIGHDQEFDRLVGTLARPMNPNALLVGEAGTGKETLVAHLAFKLVKDEVPRALFDKRLVSLEINNLVAGATPDELSLRLQKIVEEITIAGNIILYIPEIHNLVKTSGTAYISAADALLPIIRSSTFPIVGATYPREFKEYIESRSDFTALFEVIRVEEISKADAERALTYDALLLEREYRLTISFGAIKKAVVLAHKYLRQKFLPSSAEELLKDALVETKKRDEKVVSADIVMDVLEAKVNIPVREATGVEAERLLNLEEMIHKRLINQDEAVKAISDALREYRSGLSRGTGPIASFLFVGPTGVGKTELAKILSRVQFGSEAMMVRFDMTEYQDKQSFYRFIGSPDGQISGALTDAILKKPYSLILLDEFEKAFPDILNLFLQVFDDGRLTDNLGRTVDFSNTVIVATSNAHSELVNEALSKGESMSDVADYLKKRLVDVFKPELLNRFSRVVVFKNLEPGDLEKIAVLNLEDLAQSVKNQGLEMEFEPAAIKQIVKLGYDPAFGARPLRRVIEEKIRAPLASAILENKLGRGDKVKLVLRGDDFDFVAE